MPGVEVGTSIVGTHTEKIDGEGKQESRGNAATISTTSVYLHAVTGVSTVEVEAVGRIAASLDGEHNLDCISCPRHVRGKFAILAALRRCAQGKIISQENVQEHEDKVMLRYRQVRQVRQAYECDRIALLVTNTPLIELPGNKLYRAAGGRRVSQFLSTDVYGNVVTYCKSSNTPMISAVSPGEMDIYDSTKLFRLTVP